MATVILPFALQGTPVHVAVTSANTTVAITPSALSGLSSTIALTNYGANNVFVQFGNTLAEAVATSGAGIVVPPGRTRAFARSFDTPTGVFFIGAICAATQSSSLSVEIGIGTPAS